MFTGGDMNKELIKQAIEALESCSGAPHWETLQPTLTDLRKALVSRPSLPDEITDNSESPEYRTGWNECREVMAGMQADSEADKVIIEYHEATIKRLEAELKARGNT